MKYMSWLGLLLLSGCGTSAASIEGTVSYNGTPIDDGAIVFVPTGGENPVKRGTKIVNGAYRIEATEGILPGTYQVVFNWNKKTGKKVPIGDGAGVRDETTEGLPAKFNTATTQRCEVKSGGNTLNFPLAD